MKKLCYMLIAVAVCAAIFCSACSSDPTENVSERRSRYYAASDEDFELIAVSGVREDPYISDGIAATLVPYTLVTLVPKEFDVDAVYEYTATVGDSAFGGAMTVHPFAASFSAEFAFETKKDFTLELRSGGKKTVYELKSQIPDGAITYGRAVDAAVTALDPSGAYEVRARIIKNPLDGDGLCWHVSFITASGQTGVLLDITTAKVLAKKDK